MPNRQAKQRHVPALRPTSNRPARLLLLWAIFTILCLVDALIFPGESYGLTGAVLLPSVAPILAGLFAGWVLKIRASTLGLITALLHILIVLEIIRLLFESASLTNAVAAPPVWILPSALLIFTAATIWGSYENRSKWRRSVAIALATLTLILVSTAGTAERQFWDLTQQAQALIGKDTAKSDDHSYEIMSNIKADRLWSAQSELVQRQLSTLKPRLAGRQNIVAIAVAADGSQQLFSREAELALKVASSRFAGNFRGGVLLSNGIKNILNAPLATRANFLAVTKGLGNQIDPVHDIAFVYLTSHGSRNAWLSTGLPNYQELQPISARSVDEALKIAGITRRVVVISACYAASWIPQLANDDTIVIAAAAKDRTSFGCDDERRLTFFGEAFLEGPLSREASLQEAFQTAELW